MKPPFKLFQITVLAASVAIMVSACGKKDSAAEAEDAAKTESSALQSMTDSVTAAAADDAAKEAEAAAAKAQAEAEAATAKAQAEAEAAKKQAEEQVAAAKAEAEAAAAAAKAEAEAAAAAAKAEAEAAAAAAKAEAEAAAAEAQAQMESVQAQAAEMLAKYSGEIDALKANVSKLAEIVDKNADVLPAGVAEKYGELKTLVPEVSSMVQSLKDYKGTDLTNLVSKIETDFGKAADLYKETMALIPEGLSLDSVKVPGT